MRIISLNIWGGKLFEPLLRFISDESAKTDIFCFQEVFFPKDKSPSLEDVRIKLFPELKRVLSDFTAIEKFSPKEALFERKRLPDHLLIGLAIFVKKRFDVSDSGGFITYDPEGEVFLREGKHNCGDFAYAKIKSNNREVLIGNLHGLWQSDGKGDSSDRNYQTKKIMDFFHGYNCGKILVGDFNIRPETASIKTFGEHFTNLIEANKVTKTRTNLYKDMEKYRDYISDYAFVSPEISVKGFTVPSEIVVSDHLPLIVDFSI